MAGTPTHLFMKSLTVMGARLVLDNKKKGGDSWRKEDFLPGSACLEGVPSPVQLGRIRDGHGPLCAALSSGLGGFFLLSELSRKLAGSLAR